MQRSIFSVLILWKGKQVYIPIFARRNEGKPETNKINFLRGGWVGPGRVGLGQAGGMVWVGLGGGLPCL